jgi:5-(carboxyamino)imidazole ribonucleotide mutase
MATPPVIIISGSASDDAIVKKVTSVLDDNMVDYDSYVISAHRNPETLEDLLETTKTEAKVYITIAGLSAALPGVVASKVTQPVIGVPVSSKLGGLDALLSIVQMPKGVPVATVGIDNGQNAAHLAIRILDLF